MSWLGGPLPGYETEIGLDPGNPDWVAPFTGPVISNPFAQSSEPSIGEQVGNMAGDYLSQHTNPIKGITSSSGSSSNPAGMDRESGIEKITDGLYLYNPAKFLGDYQAQMQQGSSSSGLKGLVKNAAGAAISYGISKALPLAFACDMRLKTDVSSLETTDVNDDLAEVAFFVKGLRECA